MADDQQDKLLNTYFGAFYMTIVAVLCRQ